MKAKHLFLPAVASGVRPRTRSSLIHCHGPHISAKLRLTRVPKQPRPLVSAGRQPAQCLPLHYGVLVILFSFPSAKTELHSEPGHVQAGEPGVSTARALLPEQSHLGKEAHGSEGVLPGKHHAATSPAQACTEPSGWLSADRKLLGAGCGHFSPAASTWGRRQEPGGSIPSWSRAPSGGGAQLQKLGGNYNN